MRAPRPQQHNSVNGICAGRVVRGSILLLLLALTSPVLLSQSKVVVSGTITDSHDHSEIPGAYVSIRLNDSVLAGGASDISGRFSLTSPRHAGLRLVVESIGYHTRSVDLDREHVAGSRLAIALEWNDVEGDVIEVIGESGRNNPRNVGTMSRISPATLDLVRPVGTQEMLEYVPGVNGFSDDGMGNSRLNIGIRGLNPRRSSRVLVLEDGVPIQPAPYIYPNMYYNPPTERIERIEVLKGSAAIEYGPQTMGGVINYITSRPRYAPGGMVELSAGTNGLASGYLEVGGVGGASTELEGQFLYKRGDGYRRNNEFEQLNGTVKLTLTPSETKSVYIKGNVDHEVAAATYTGLTEYSFRVDPSFNPKEDDEFTIDRYSIDGVLHEELSLSVRSTTRAYFNRFERDWWREDDVFYRADEYDADRASATPVPWFEPGDLVRAGNGTSNFGILRNFVSLGVEQSYRLSHSLVDSSRATALLGGRLHWERFEDHKVVGDAPDARDGIFYRTDPGDSSITILGSAIHYETVALSLYAREGVEFGPLSVTVGARLEAFEQEQIDRLRGSVYADKTSLIVLPGLGLNYAIGDVNLFGGVHRGYTPPSSGALKAVGFAGATPAGEGIDLRSEKSWNVEVGVRGSSKVVAFELAAFDIMIEDLVAAGRGTLFRNLGSARSIGVESGLTVRGSKLVRGLPTLDLSWTLLEATVLDGIIPSAVLAGDVPVDISGNDLPYAPRHTVSAGLTGSIGKTVSLRGDVRYVSSSFSDFENITTTSARGDTGPIPAHLTLNASLSWRATSRLRLGLTGKNLTDEIYIGSLLHSNPRQPEAGQSSGIIPGGRRQLTLTAGYSFGAL